MSLAQQMIDDCITILSNTDEHAVLVLAMDENGLIIREVPVIIDHKTIDVEKVPYGRDTVKRAMVGIPSSYNVDDDWKFKLDDTWWAVARDEASPIADDSAGWLWVTVTSAPIHDRGDPEYNERK